MGNITTNLSKSLGLTKEPLKILTFGLDAAGKTTMLYKLKLGEIITTIPTIGYNVETLYSKDMNLIAWDVGGRDKSNI